MTALSLVMQITEIDGEWQQVKSDRTTP
jgi:hypothetical protein